MKAPPASNLDDPSPYAFLGASFDTLCETDQFSLSDRGLSPMEGDRNRTFCGGYQPGCPLTPPVFAGRPPEVTEVKPCLTDNSDAYSIGDLSPIKLVYHTNGTISEACHPESRCLDDRSTEVAADLLHAQSTDSEGKLSGLYADSGSVSNPFYVLRSVGGAFQGCKYLLPCVCEKDICPVNITTVGHIHHYTGDPVRAGVEFQLCLPCFQLTLPIPTISPATRYRSK
jgi:hypothetical protein